MRHKREVQVLVGRGFVEVSGLFLRSRRYSGSDRQQLKAVADTQQRRTITWRQALEAGLH